MAKPSGNTRIKVLFIGNSFTARNNLPGLIAQLGAARGLQLQHRLVSAGGASLRMHWNKGDAKKAILETRYDYVVLQEQSTLPVKNPVRMHENIRLFDEAIKDAGAKTVLYLTWARKNAPETQTAITEAYSAIGKELGATIVPVGIAWESLLHKHKQPELYDPDQSHPTLAGSYFAACVFFAVLFGQSPIGIVSGLKGLTHTDIELLQNTAWGLYSNQRKRSSVQGSPFMW